MQIKVASKKPWIFGFSEVSLLMEGAALSQTLWKHWLHSNPGGFTVRFCGLSMEIPGTLKAFQTVCGSTTFATNPKAESRKNPCCIVRVHIWVHYNWIWFNIYMYSLWSLFYGKKSCLHQQSVSFLQQLIFSLFQEKARDSMHLTRILFYSCSSVALENDNPTIPTNLGFLLFGSRFFGGTTNFQLVGGSDNLVWEFVEAQPVSYVAGWSSFFRRVIPEIWKISSEMSFLIQKEQETPRFTNKASPLMFFSTDLLFSPWSLQKIIQFALAHIFRLGFLLKGSTTQVTNSRELTEVPFSMSCCSPLWATFFGTRSWNAVKGFSPLVGGSCRASVPFFRVENFLAWPMCLIHLKSGQIRVTKNRTWAPNMYQNCRVFDGFWRELPLFEGNEGWWNIIIWPW